MKGVVSGLKHDSTVQYGTVIQYHTVVGKWSTEIMGRDEAREWGERYRVSKVFEALLSGA
jgi:hypothetical protein